MMAPVSTGGVGSGVARWPTQQIVDGPHVDGWCRPRCSMAHALTGGIGISARAVPRPPPCARRPPGAAIVDEWLWFFFYLFPPSPSLLMSIFATVFSHLFSQLCSPPLPFPPPCFILFRSVALHANLPEPPPPIICRSLLFSPVRTILPSKSVLNYCLIALALMGGRIFCSPPPLHAGGGTRSPQVLQELFGLLTGKKNQGRGQGVSAANFYWAPKHRRSFLVRPEAESP